MKLHGLKPVASWSEILKRPFFILALKGKVFWPRMYKQKTQGKLPWAYGAICGNPAPLTSLMSRAVALRLSITQDLPFSQVP